MNDMTPGIGHNAPPDPLDEALARYDADREEAESWLDGKAVENEAQMNAVDDLTATMKESKRAVDDAKESEYRPHKTKCDDVVEKYKPTLADQDRIIKGLVSIVGAFKTKLAAKLAEEQRLAWVETEKKRKAADELAAAARAGDIESERAAAQAKQDAIDAEKTTKAIAKAAPKGMRKTTHYEITDHSDLLRWMNKHARADLEAAAQEYVRRNHQTTPMAGVRVWETKEAF